jgi:hypothetical protein
MVQRERRKLHVRLRHCEDVETACLQQETNSVTQVGTVIADDRHQRLARPFHASTVPPEAEPVLKGRRKVP